MSTSTSAPYRKAKQNGNQAIVSVSEKWLRAIVPADEITEVFVKGAVSGSDSFNLVGFYDSRYLAKLAADVAAYSGVAKGVYFRINPVERSLITRAPNQLLPTSKARSGTSDDITCRRFLMIDIDSTRKSGLNATQGEKEQARRLLDAVLAYLKGAGFPLPAQIDTGNGYCLMYAVDLPVDDEGLLKRILRSFDLRFSNDAAKVDTSVFDPARLARLPGTMNCKGPHSLDRPHRLCKLLRIPIGGCRPVPRDLLEKLAKTTSRAPDTIEPSAAASGSIDVIQRARAYVAKMPPAVAASGGDTATYTVAGRLVIGFGLSPEQAMPLMHEYNGRCLPPWTETELLHKVKFAFDRATRTGIARGHLAAETTCVELPQLSGGTFHGWVPDFGNVSTDNVLAPIGQFALSQQHDWIELYSGWQTLSSVNDLPDLFLRQCYFGSSYPRNWRQRFRSLVGRKTIAEEALTKGFEYECPENGCLLRSCDVRHNHFPGSTERWGLLEGFSDGSEDRLFRLYSAENSELRKELRTDRKIIKVYWPALIFGQAKMIGWTTEQQRLLVGLAAELTLGRRVSKNSIPRGEVVQDSLVVGPANKEQLVRCPLLDPNMAYVTFGGNGRSGMRGRGYQIIGRTNKGWLSRAGYPDCLRLRPKLRVEVLSQFLHNLQRLAEDLDLIVVGYHDRHRTKWEDLGELVHCLKSGSGLDWLDECTLRVYTAADWLVRWRHFFSQRLGFRWIPAAPSDEGTHPAHEVTGDERQVTGGHQIEKLLGYLGWTQERLAEEISELLGKRVSRRCVIRHCQETSHNEEFLAAVERIRQQHDIDLSAIPGSV